MQVGGFRAPAELCPAMPGADDNISVTVALVTRNRKNDLRRALHSVLEQDAAPEIVVLDDASTDGTSEMLREEFPSVSVHRHEQRARHHARPQPRNESRRQRHRRPPRR